MKLVNDSALSVGWRTWAFGPGDGVTDDRRVIVTIKATLDLPREGTCTLAAEQAPVTGDLFWDDDVERTLRYASDAALVKPRGEMWVTGTLRVPEPVRELACLARVGETEVRFDVVGDRWWRADGGMTPPEPFTSMELSWERCFGGHGFVANPAGRGLTSDPRDSEGRVALPNVEQRGRLIRSPGERPDPAGAWPIPPHWPERARWMGSYDQAYARTRWPYLAEDFGWRHFQAAPEAQQIDGYWRGDEEIELAHLHPLHPRLRCRLPGLRPRAFLHDEACPAGPLREVGLVLDTVAIDAGEGRAYAVWRGSAPCLTESLDEVRHLYVTQEPLGQSRPEQAYLDMLVARLRQLWEEEQAFEPERPPTPESKPPPALVRELEPVPSPEDLRAAQRREALERGMPVELVETLYPPELPPAVASDPVLERRQLEEARDAATALGAAEVAGALTTMIEALDAPQVDEPADAAPPPTPSPDRSPSALRELVRRRIEARESLAGMRLVGADLSALDLSGQDLSDALLTRADLHGADLRGAKLSRAILDEARFGDATLEGACLRGASLALVQATGVCLRGADLEEATFERAVLVGADLRAVLARGVSIEECLAVGAVFDGAELTEAELSRSNFDEASFRGATLTDARLEGSSLRRACLDQISAPGLRASDGADLSEASLRWARLPGASFSESVLIGTRLAESDLSRACFARARMQGAELLAVSARAATFTDAQLSAASLAGADLLGARFEGADLRLADLSTANLYQAELWRAALTDARLDGANTEGTKLS